MNMHVVYAVGNRCRITGNEEVREAIISYEELQTWRDRSDIILLNVKRAD